VYLQNGSQEKRGEKMKKYEMKINGKDFNVEIKDFDALGAKVVVNGKNYNVSVKFPETQPPVIPIVTKRPAAPIEKAFVQQPVESAGGGSSINAPMPGLILKILVKAGETVTAGQKVAIMEAMKMENDINAKVAGKVQSINVKEGDNVQENQSLLVIG
jgi:biotin carboxyl carrier protein